MKYNETERERVIGREGGIERGHCRGSESCAVLLYRPIVSTIITYSRVYVSQIIHRDGVINIIYSDIRLCYVYVYLALKHWPPCS